MKSSEYSARGFTLIELLIAMTVVAILAGIAIPSYRDYMMRTRRTDGQAALMTALARQEQYFLDNKTYTASMADLGYPSDPASSESGYYRVSILAAGATIRSFTLQAVPTGAQASDPCGTLTITYLGVKGKTGGASLQQCW